MKTAWLPLLLAAGLLVLAAGCTGQAQGSGELPEYAYRSQAAVQGYRDAVAHRELLAKIPCYCGCGRDPQYRSLADCFFDPKGGFNSHAANCPICLDEAADAARWRTEGLSAAQIRAAIDNLYRERGPATETPPLEADDQGVN